MGVKYSASESAALIQAMGNNIRLANEITDRLSSGCNHLISSLDSGELQGAAYTAGKGLFTDIIIPSIKKLQAAIDDIQVKLTTYQNADSQISKYGTLDRDQLLELKKLRSLQLQTIQAQITENESFIKQASSLLTGQYGDLWDDTSILYSAKQQLEIGIQDIETKLETLEWFMTQVSGCFADSLVVLQLAIQGATQLSQVLVDSDGGYSTAGLDMSRVVDMKAQEIKNFNVKKHTQKYYQTLLEQRIKTIKNSSASDLEKSEQIVVAYEDYLYFLNKKAFDEYWEVKKNYDGEWDPVNDSYASRIEEKLGQRLQKSGVDFRVILNRMGDDILSVQDISGLNRIELNTHFYNLVQTEHPLDLKSRTYNGNNYSIWSRRWGTTVSVDYAGNYLYGYVGSGLLHASDIYLKGAAGAAQVLSDKDILKWLNNVLTGHFGDNKGDSKMIQEGLDAYHKKIKDYIEEHGELPNWTPVQR